MEPQDKIAKAEALLSEAQAELEAALRGEKSRARGALAGRLWRLRRMSGAVPEYFSQSGQDWFVDQVLMREGRNGVFVDVGGFDGVEGSNSLFFELFRGWTGVLVEPVSDLVDRARQVRRCPCIEAAVSGDGATRDFLEVATGYRQMSGLADIYDGNILEQVRAHPAHSETVRRIATRTLGDILAEQSIAAVDYLSLDIEGAEAEVLRSFPFDDVQVGVFSIENAAGNPEIADIMSAQGYRLTEFLGVDEIYCDNELIETRLGEIA